MRAFGYDYQRGGPLVETELRHMCQKGEDMSSYTEGQVHQLANTLEGAGFTPDHLRMLGQDKEEVLTGLKGVFDGTHEITPVEPTLEVHTEEGLEKRGDDLYVDGQKVVLCRSKRQVEGKTIQGYEPRKVLNACVLDYLQAHPEIWPESWKKDDDGNIICVFFRGTTFRRLVDGRLCVRYGFWINGRVVSDYDWLDLHYLYWKPPASFRTL